MSYVRLTNALGLSLDRGRFGVLAWAYFFFVGLNHWTKPRVDKQVDTGYGRRTVQYEVTFAWFHAGVARQGRNDA